MQLRRRGVLGGVAVVSVKFDCVWLTLGAASRRTTENSITSRVKVVGHDLAKLKEISGK